MSGYATRPVSSGAACRGFRPFLAVFAAATLSMFAAPAFAASPLRVAAWNIDEPSATTNGVSQKTPEARIKDAAVALRNLKPEPDVIILEQVRDWQMCQRLVDALQPATYSVQVCSAFRDPVTGAAGRHQIAILSRHKAYFSWSEAWRAEDRPLSGGFAFAAIRAGGQRLGFFAVQLGEAPAGPGGQDPAIGQSRTACLQQWMREVGSFEQWITNRVEAVIVAGGYDQLPGGAPLTPSQAAFARSLLRAPLTNPTFLPKESSRDRASNYLSVRLAPEPDGLAEVVLDRSPATCVIDISGARPPATAITQNDPPPPEPVPKIEPPPTPVAQSDLKAVETAPSPAPAAPSTPTGAGNSATQTVAVAPPPLAAGSAVPGWRPAWPMAGLAAGLFAFVVAFWRLVRRKPASPAPSQTVIALDATEAVVITTQSVTGSASDAAPPRPMVRVEGEAEQWRRRALAAEERAERTAEAVRRGLLPQMRRWLKERLFRKVIEDRAALLETQQAATLKALAVDERLSRIEKQIQEQNAVYERRIEELTHELAAAREENRDLIRAKIAQVKAEMEAARAKALQQARRG